MQASYLHHPGMSQLAKDPWLVLCEICRARLEAVEGSLYMSIELKVDTGPNN